MGDVLVIELQVGLVVVGCELDCYPMGIVIMAPLCKYVNLICIPCCSYAVLSTLELHTKVLLFFIFIV